MTPATFRYIARLYEQAVDAGLNVEAIRHYLASRGILRSTFQIVDELDRVYSFAGYSASHPPAPSVTAQDWDAQMGS